MMTLSIITPEKTVYDAAIDQVTLQTTEGEITVLPHHIPYVAELKPGELRIVRDGKEEPMVIAGGFIEVLPGDSGATGGRIAILADEAIRVEELDIVAIEAARERARQALAEKRFADDTAFAATAAALERELAKHRVALKYRKRG
ncbi:MAG: ATP synthase F1 subunit epsilon [bacterium]|nr:ATP synthase F1 subunit epsilon [bacterium]